jgi:hypothetical protein
MKNRGAVNLDITTVLIAVLLVVLIVFLVNRI